MLFRCNCKPLRIAPASSSLHTYVHAPKMHVQAARDGETDSERESGGSHLSTHFTDNQIKAGIQYITDKLFIKQKAWIAAQPRLRRRLWTCGAIRPCKEGLQSHCLCPGLLQQPAWHQLWFKNTVQSHKHWNNIMSTRSWAEAGTSVATVWAPPGPPTFKWHCEALWLKASSLC